MSTWLTWVLTVASLTTSRSAISAFERPRASSAQHLALARGEPESSAAAARRRRRRHAGEGLDDAAGDGRGEQRLARARRRGSPRSARPAGASLSRKPLAPARRRLVDVLVEVEGGEDEDPRRRSPSATSRRVASRPSTLRHPDVHEHDVGPERRTAATASSPSAASPTTSSRAPRRAASEARRASSPGRRRSRRRSSAHGSAVRARTRKPPPGRGPALERPP